MKQLWVRDEDRESRYAISGSSWRLGTVVGVSQLSTRRDSTMKEALEGEKPYNRYLIELDGGKVVEAWEWDTYEPAEKSES